MSKWHVVIGLLDRSNPRDSLLVILLYEIKLGKKVKHLSPPSPNINNKQ